MKRSGLSEAGGPKGRHSPTKIKAKTRGRGKSDLPPGSVIAALDVGSSKISCFIGKTAHDSMIDVIGVGHQAAQGVKSGNIIDLKAAEAAMGQSIHAAERMAAGQMMGQSLQRVFVNVPGTQTLSHNIAVEVNVQGHNIGDKDIYNALSRTHELEVAGQDELIHTIPAGFRVDGNSGVKEPRGMFGKFLDVDIHAMTAMTGCLKNLSSCINHNHLDIEGFCASAYAAGLSCLVEDEMDLGAVVIDMGGGTTDIAVFIEGVLIYHTAIPLGGAHVTNDVARGLTCSLTDAERIKTLFGSATSNINDDNELIDVPQIGEQDHSHPNHIPKSLLTGIIQPRLEETFELVRAKLDDTGMGQVAGRRVVLTGGASQLSGLRELGQLVLDKQIRLGAPTRLRGLPESTSGPAFATTAGLLHYAADHAEDYIDESPVMIDPTTLFQRVGQWLRENW